jgi:hypothetical protein
MGLAIGQSLGIEGLRLLTVSGVNPGALAAVTAVNVDMAVDGVAVGDIVFVISPPAALEARLVLQGVSVLSAGVVRFRFTNQSAAAATGAALAYVIGHIRLT